MYGQMAMSGGIPHSNRGMELEELIRYANEQYKTRGNAVVDKIPTPAKICRGKDNKVKYAYFEEKSTVDFNGVYITSSGVGRFVAFEAKETMNKSGLPLAIVQKHQVEYLDAIMAAGGSGFVIVETETDGKCWFCPGQLLVNRWKDRERYPGKKGFGSVAVSEMTEIPLGHNGIALDWLTVLYEAERLLNPERPYRI